MNEAETEKLDEELTAYLDGELSANAAADLEARLVNDESLRQRLAELRKAYDLLDDLPLSTPRQSFTQTTIEMVVEDLRRSSSIATNKSASSTSNSSPQDDTNKLPKTKKDWFVWPTSLWLATAASLLGVLIGSMLVFFQSRSELAQLDIAANMPGLQDASELSVITELAKEKELIEYLRSHYYDRMIPIVPRSLWGRRTWVHGLNNVQLAKLDNARDLLNKFPADIRNRWNAIQTQIDTAPDAESLNQTVRIIGMVLDSMPTAKRQDLEVLTASEEKLRFLKEQLSLRAAMFYAADLQSDDANALDEWSKNELLPAIITAMPFLRRETDVKTAMMALTSARPIEDGFRLPDQDELVTSLTNRLSTMPKYLLEGIDRNDQLLVLSTWMVPEGLNSKTRLVDSYERLRRELRDDIDLADPNEVRRLLRDRSRRGNAGTRPNR